jgi:4,5-DOPA dioxygenase extradiol
MPVIFIGHGSPINLIQNNAFTKHLHEWGKRLPRPKVILSISAHWLTSGQTAVGVQARPKTIYDFGGFPKALYEIDYPAPGAPAIAREVAQLLKSDRTTLDKERGLDHGTWAVLHHLYPEADVPVFQLSIDYDQPAAFHYAVGQALAVLRDKGVLIMGSGNIVHNLWETQRALPENKVASQPWAQAFDLAAKDALDRRDDGRLIDYERLDPAAKIAVPMPDHYFPLMYSLGAAGSKEKALHVFEGFQFGTLSMRCLQFGA